MEEEQEAGVDLLDLLDQLLLVVDVVPKQHIVVATVARPRTVTSTDCTVDNTLRCILVHSRLAAVVDMLQLLRMRCLLNISIMTRI